MDIQDTTAVGTRLLGFRLRRHMTQTQLATAVGVTPGHISQLETGKRRLGNNATILALCKALAIAPADLLGGNQPPSSSFSDAASLSVPDVRAAWLTTSLDMPTDREPARSGAELLRDTRVMMQLREQCEYAQVGAVLPNLIYDSHAMVAAGTTRFGLEMLVWQAYASTLWLKNLAYGDLAYIAAQRGLQAAYLLENPVAIGLSEFALAQALFGMGAAQVERAQITTANAAQQIGDEAGPEGYHVRGALLLSTAYAASCAGRPGDVYGPLDEARGIAAHTEDTNEQWLNFADWNIHLWEMAFALEEQDAPAVLAAADEVVPEQMPRSRRTHYHIDKARGLALYGGPRDKAAVRELSTAYQLAPERLVNNPFAREILEVMLRRARLAAGGPDLRGLCAQMGIPT
jgi:transcriptional regulator with XRE-family HTH domain